ncbi:MULTISPECIES: ABC transporter ATP-binding protein [Pantoea]|jgi:lipopolysaccharide transport system ATP-binding protein|uniref:ABC transporter ATP-binding protein n=1 Tax=Pantoea TaxID=53335 RepID=UPI000EA350C4|nr:MULTISPECIES: ABC transporter ATP-binding protein [Pantoea]MBZ6387064.1 ABC transporter ATP-binding protein [Pantoea piersonii]MBZ6398835.1 ABC transporter ATP-binding protein [Pantoea piersonii]MBZ6408051.1 ABC transporter ATP-binding protein [Pantoea piersonii]MBZ6426886.1 ABC transporter ATP-binding protein [Pantoea piersonii]NYB00799.1 ABC transporter ATP-binding protein [Pantoea piersonii]
MSSKDNAIEIYNVGKCYQVYENPVHRLKQFIFPRIDRAFGKTARSYHDDFWALKDVSFELPKGQTMGIVGRNGSGKSTLLQIIAGTLSPSCGNINVRGRVAALLELGAGFNSDFTGRENIYLNASLLGLTREETDSKLDDILAFADIGRFIDSPVRSYSSGMLVRLAFAVQAQIDPEILIVDEALAVGDAKFQAKCFARLKKLKENGTSILLVSHATEQIVTHCDLALLLDSGVVKGSGKPKIVINQYLDLLFGKKKKNDNQRSDIDKQIEYASAGEKERLERSEDNSPDSENVISKLNGRFENRFNYNPAEYRWGDKSAIIEDFFIEQSGTSYPSSFEHHQKINLSIKIKFNDLVIRPIFGFAVKNKEGITIYNTNSEWQEVANLDEAKAGSETVVNFSFPNLLYEGDYFISLGVASSDTNGEIIPHDRRYDSIHISVAPVKKFTGFTDLSAKIEIVHE